MARAPVRSFLQARDPSVDRRYRPRPLRRVNLDTLLAESDEDKENESETNSDYESESTGSTVSTNNSNGNLPSDGALVYLRLRPIGNEPLSTAYTPDGNILVTNNQADADKGAKNRIEKHFTFTDIMDGAVAQAKVYDICIRRSIENEESLTVLTYGTSGSGKTYTQIGDNENPGLIPRALEHIFSLYGNSVAKVPVVGNYNAAIKFMSDDEIRAHERLRKQMLVRTDVEVYNHDRLKSLILNEHQFAASEIKEKTVFIWISFAEIYNEVVYDLLSHAYEQQLSKKKGLTIVSNKGRVFIKNLTSVYVRNSLEAQMVLKMGSQRVTFGSTAVNNHSSRSHFVFFVDIVTCTYPDIFVHHSYKFSDLAGSERLDKTKNVGNRLKEAQQINKSLLVLGRCLDAVYHNQQKRNADVVPFRDSKLTTLLQAPLVGKERMTMIVNINPTDEYFEENMHVLAFSSIAKNLIFKEKPKKEVKRSRYSWLAAQQPSFGSFDSTDDENKTLREQVELLTDETRRLERLLVTQEKELKNRMIADYEQRMQRIEENWQKRFDVQEKYYQERIRVMEEQLRNKRKYSLICVSDSEGDDIQ